MLRRLSLVVQFKVELCDFFAFVVVPLRLSSPAVETLNNSMSRHVRRLNAALGITYMTFGLHLVTLFF